jgi:hypothetical protein
LEEYDCSGIIQKLGFRPVSKIETKSLRTVNEH